MLGIYSVNFVAKIKLPLDLWISVVVVLSEGRLQEADSPARYNSKTTFKTIFHVGAIGSRDG